MHSKDLLIFDLDGTLIDSKADIATAVNLTLQEIGKPPKTQEVIVQYIGGGVRRLLEQALNLGSGHGNGHAYGLGDEHAEDELQHVHPAIEEVLPIFRRHYLDHLMDQTILYPEVVDTLEYFKGKKLAVVTNKPMDYTTPILDGLGLSRYFQMVLGGDSTPHRKPHPEMILRTLETLQAEKHRTVMIGDGPQDIRAAQGAGVTSCAVTYGLTKLETLLLAEPDLVCHSLGHLRDLFT